MKKIIVVILATFWSCTSNNDSNSVNSNTSNLKIVEQLKVDNAPPLTTKEYVIDNSGKVLKEIFTSHSYPINNFTSTFEYDSQNRLVKEYRNNELFFKIIWTGNVAELYRETNVKVGTFTFLNEKLISMKWELDQSNIQYIKYNYDNNSNVISIEKNNEVYAEFLQYQTNVLNPLYLLKSIEIVRFSMQYNFKNVFDIQRLLAYNGSDYIFQTTNYEYFRTLDTTNRVVSETNMKSLIYKTTYYYN